ncbi:MAG: tetratricopeptide repeat protein [Spirochaetota bacterium]
MTRIPYRPQKAILGGALLLILSGAAYFSLHQTDPLRGFDPAGIVDERDARVQSLLELLKLDNEDYRTQAELAKLYFELGELDNAERHALAAVAIGRRKNADREFMTNQFLLLSKIYQAKGDQQKALEYASRAAESDPTKTAPLKRKGQVFEAQRKNDKARLEYLKALKLDEKDPETYALLAAQEFKKGNRKAAMEWLKMGVRRNPTNAIAFRNLARGYVRTGELQKGREAYERALALDPNNAGTRHEYAKLLKKMGERDRYVAELRKAHNSDPKNPKILADLGDVELAAGNKRAALAYYRDALSRDGKNTKLREKYNALYNEMLAEQGKKSSGPAVAAGSNGAGTGNGSTAAGSGNADAAGSGNAAGKPDGGAATAKNQEPPDTGLSGGKPNEPASQGITKELEAGKKAFAEKDFGGAEDYFRRALEKAPDSQEARFFLARSLDAQGKKDAAMAEYRKVLAKEPEHAKANYYLGRLLYQAQKFGEAERAFQKSVNSDGQFAPARYSLALAQEKQGKNNEALAAYRKAAETDSSLTQAHFNSAILLKKNKRYDEALAELAKSGKGSEVEYQRGEIFLKQKKYAESKEAFGRVLSEKPQHYEAAFNLALAHHKLGDPAGADKVLSRVIRDDSPADLHYTYGKLLEESGETAGAEKQYRISVQKDARYFKGWLNLGRVTSQGQKFDQAEHAYRQALLIEPASYEANFNLANALFKQKKYQTAIEYFENARRNDANREVVLPLASSYENTSQPEKAAKVYNDFLRENPKDRVVLERLGYLYYRKTKEKDKALEQFNKLLKYYPDSEKAQEYKGMVQLIEKQKGEQQ